MVKLRRDVERMIEQQIRSRGVRDPRVIDAMRRVSRHHFVTETMRHRAYEPGPVPIGEGQTISAPYVVARMLELLSLRGDERVLEIGAGSGYVTALLALLARRVVALERVGALARTARTRLERLGVPNAVVLCADGTLGWSDEAPYDAVLVAAGAPELPSTLFEQLADGARLVIPVGGRDRQQLMVYRRDGDHVEEMDAGECRFVPLLGRYGWTDGR